MRLLGLLLILYFLPLLVDAQSFFDRRRDRSIIVFGGSGISTYFGDLNNPDDLLDTKLNIDLGLRFQFDERFSVRGNFIWFRLQGSDQVADFEPTIERNLSFRSDNIEASVEGTAFLWPEGQRFYQRKKVNLYGVAGAGIMRFNPKAQAPADFNGTPLDEAGEWVALQPLNTEGADYSRITPVVLVGGGIVGRINPFFNIALEGTYRFTFTDYIDDVSTEHVDPNPFTDPLAGALADRRPEIGEPRAAAGSIRGNPDKNDAYFIINIKVEHYITPSSFIYDIFYPDKLRTVKRKRYRRPKRREP